MSKATRLCSFCLGAAFVNFSVPLAKIRFISYNTVVHLLNLEAFP